MGSKIPHYAVLMGDLVHSENVPDRAVLHATFNAAIDRQNRLRADALASPLTITLGDEFQGLVRSLVAGFETARALRLDLLDHGVECRFALGIVTLATPLNAERAWNMMGPGLAATRERLNEKKDDRLYRFVVPENPLIEALLDASAATMTAMERGWSETQRHDIEALLDGQTPAQIAEGRNVSVRSIYKTRLSGGFNLYKLHLEAIRQALAHFDAQYRIGAAAP